jgi:glycosyltransferase involved in cell wall biosynthesis
MDARAGGLLRLSVLIPVFNERPTIGRVLAAVAGVMPEVSKELVIVDDGSSDGTREFLARELSGKHGPVSRVALREDGGLDLERANRDVPGSLRFKVIFHDANQGKGAAVRTAMSAASGDVVVVQDADLEYDPQDWAVMYDLIAVRQVADVVFGSRFFGRPHRSLYFHHFLANRLISILFNLIYNQTLSDIEVCYKMLARRVVDTLDITCRDFGCEVQISAQIALRHWRIYEVGISYFGRTYAEGKKINWKDGVKALWYVVKFRFARRRSAPAA